MFSIQNTFILTQISFVVIFQLGNRLKYFDPQKLHTAEDEDPDWLQHLSRINAGFQVIFLFNTFLFGHQSESTMLQLYECYYWFSFIINVYVYLII